MMSGCVGSGHLQLRGSGAGIHTRCHPGQPRKTTNSYIQALRYNTSNHLPTLFTALSTAPFNTFRSTRGSRLLHLVYTVETVFRMLHISNT